MDRGQGSGREPAAVGDQDHVRCQDVHQLLQLPGAQRGQEPLHHGVLLGPAHPHPRLAGRHVLAGPPRDLPHRPRGLPDGRGDLAVGQVEDLAEHEHRPLGRPERFQHGQHRDRDALRELDVLGDIGAGQQRLRQPLADVVLAAARQRPQPVERLAGDDPDEVGPRVTHLRAVDAGPPQPGLLHHVLRIGRRAEHLVGDREQQAAMGGERVRAGHAAGAARGVCGRRASGISHASE